MPVKFNTEFIQRFKHASAAEIAHRVRKKLIAFQAKRAGGQKRLPFEMPAVPPGQIQAIKMPQFNFVLNGNQTRLDKGAGMPGLSDNAEQISHFESQWHDAFFDEVRCCPGDPDMRSVWDPARLQEPAGLLLQAWRDNGKSREGAEAVLQWIHKNPFPFGPHYKSAMESGLRVPVFLYCLKTAKELGETEQTDLLRAVYGHAWWIANNLSLYASLGNHTVCECVGLVFAGAIFSHTDEGKRWTDTGYRLLDQELKHQVLADGGPAEQSLSYHRFVLDLYWLAKNFLERNNLRECSHWTARLEMGESFLAAFQIDGGSFPSIGDSDDGHAIGPGVTPIRCKAKPCQDTITTFVESGYTVVKQGQGFSLIFDHGPLGMPPLYNHGHADALSVTLSFKGKPVLVDPGTFRYNGVPEWRRYFKSTRAHNTVTVDGQDQAVQETGFIWSKPYKATLEKAVSGDKWVFLRACHDGYTRLKGPVIHERTVFIEDQGLILIRDTFKGKGVHDFELNFHLHPETKVVRYRDGWLDADMDGVKAFVLLLEGGEFKVVRGQEQPIRGSYSPAYGVKVESPVLSASIRGRAEDSCFVTVVALNSPCDTDALKERFLSVERQTENS